MFSLKVYCEGRKAVAIDERVEIVHGAAHLFRDVSAEKNGISFGSLPSVWHWQEARSETLFVLGVPGSIEAAEFFEIVSSFSDMITKLECIRNGTTQIMLLSFDSLSSADAFYLSYSVNLLPFETAICYVLFARSVQFTDSPEEACIAPLGLTEIPTCTYCLRRLDEHISGVPPSSLNTFDLRNSSCLVCHYCLEFENTTCSACPTSDDLWVCVICGFVGCGRYKEGHAIRHWKETRHCYSLELGSQRVWDYEGDNYVHRIIPSKTDGNLMELMAPSSEDCASCECSGRADESYYGSCDIKLDSLYIEYESLWAKQFESQKKYYEGQLDQMLEERESKLVSSIEAIEKHASARLQKLQQKLDKVEEEKNFLSQVNQCFTDNQTKWEKKCHDLAERGLVAIKFRDQRVAELEQKMESLMKQLE